MAPSKPQIPNQPKRQKPLTVKRPQETPWLHKKKTIALITASIVLIVILIIGLALALSSLDDARSGELIHNIVSKGC